MWGPLSDRGEVPSASLAACRDLLAAGRGEKVLIDKASGTLDRRPGLDQALEIARAGDHLVTKLDRLGRSLEHLIALAKDLQAREIDLVVLDKRLVHDVDRLLPGRLVSVCHKETGAGALGVSLEQLVKALEASRPSAAS